jgi:hypothetical protein
VGIMIMIFTLSSSATTLNLDFKLQGLPGTSLSAVQDGRWTILLKTSGIGTDKLTAQIKDRLLVVSGNGNEIDGKPEAYTFSMEYHADSESIMLTSNGDHVLVEVLLCD